MTEIHDWGSDVAAYNKWFAEQGGWSQFDGGRFKDRDDGRTADRMFDRTRYEQKSYEAYSRLLERGHRA